MMLHNGSKDFMKLYLNGFFLNIKGRLDFKDIVTCPKLPPQNMHLIHPGHGNVKFTVAALSEHVAERRRPSQLTMFT